MYLRCRFDNNGIHERAAIVLFHYFMKIAGASTLTTGSAFKPKCLHYVVKEGVLITDCQVVNYLLTTNTTNDFLLETNSENTRYAKPLTMLPLKFANELWFKTLRCPQVYEEYVLMGFFVEGLLQTIRQGMQSYWSSHKTAQRQKMAHSGKRWRIMPQHPLKFQALAHPRE